MTTHIGLLRAVNVGGRNSVGMAELRSLLDKLGMQDVRTLLQSGNVVFRSDMGGARLEGLLENEAQKRLGLETEFFLRSAADWKAIIAGNPFRAEARRDPGRLVLMCLKEAPERTDVAALQKAITGREVVRASGRHAYLVYPDGQGRSRLTLALIQRKLGTSGTARNWNTVLKLGTLAGAGDA
jgi:uncharacterized protein (DUF1697 family)